MSTTKTEHPMVSLKAALETRATDYKAMLPANVSPQRFIQTALLALAKSPELQSADRPSLFLALREACRYGLEIGDRGMWLTMFKSKVVPIPSYKALITLAKRSHGGPRLVARLVRDGDKFHVFQGTNARIEHEVRDVGAERAVTHVYSIAHFPDGTFDFEVMEAWECEKIAKRSAAGMRGPWGSDFGQMASKTVLKRHVKRLDISPEMAELVEADNAVESGDVKQSAMIEAIVGESDPAPSQPATADIVSSAIRGSKQAEVVPAGEQDDGLKF